METKTLNSLILASLCLLLFLMFPISIILGLLIDPSLVETIRNPLIKRTIPEQVLLFDLAWMLIWFPLVVWQASRIEKFDALAVIGEQKVSDKELDLVSLSDLDWLIAYETKEGHFTKAKALIELRKRKLERPV